MALNSKVKVPIPESGIIISRSSKHKYVYKVLKTYRNEKGQPTNDRVSIGKLDPETVMLIPNNKYYEYYSEPEIELLPTYDSNRSIGASFSLDIFSMN